MNTNSATIPVLLQYFKVLPAGSLLQRPDGKHLYLKTNEYDMVNLKNGLRVPVNNDLEQFVDVTDTYYIAKREL